MGYDVSIASALGSGRSRITRVVTTSYSTGWIFCDNTAVDPGGRLYLEALGGDLQTNGNPFKVENCASYITTQKTWKIMVYMIIWSSVLLVLYSSRGERNLHIKADSRDKNTLYISLEKSKTIDVKKLKITTSRKLTGRTVDQMNIL